MLTNTQANAALVTAGYVRCRVYNGEDMLAEVWQGKRGLVTKLVWPASDRQKIFHGAGVPEDNESSLVDWLD